MSLIIGNIFALIASLLMVYTGLIKKKKKILLVQSLETLSFVVSNIILGGISGIIINSMNLINLFLCYNNKLKYIPKLLMSLTAIVLVFLFNNHGIIGLFPLVALITYLWFITVKDIVKFKLLIIIILLFWLVYDFVVKSYVSCIFDSSTIIANLIAIYQIKKGIKK
jgi:hypothetical protein